MKIAQEVPDSVWKKSFQRIKEMTLSTKLRSFQYRLLNFAIITNVHLFKWKMKDNENCTFCGKDQENYIHLFVKCKEVKTKIWLPLKRWLYHFCNTEFDIEVYDIIFNRYRDSFQLLVNNIILITKQYIYAKRCMNEKLNFVQLIARIETFRAMEEIIAKKNGNIVKFNAKWSIYDKV